MSENIYIHYGSDKFEKELFMSIVNRNMINKPFGGLWASDIKADQPWEKWCIDNDFRIDKLDKNFKFTLDDSANIVEWTAKADLKRVPTQDLIYRDISQNIYLIQWALCQILRRWSKMELMQLSLIYPKVIMSYIMSFTVGIVIVF